MNRDKKINSILSLMVVMEAQYFTLYQAEQEE